MVWEKQRFRVIKEKIVEYMAEHGNVPVEIEKVARDTHLSFDDVEFFHEVMRLGEGLRPGFLVQDEGGRKWFLYHTDKQALQVYIAPAGESLDISGHTKKGAVDTAKVANIEGNMQKWCHVLTVLTKVFLVIAASTYVLSLINVIVPLMLALISSFSIDVLVNLLNVFVPLFVLFAGGLIALHVDKHANRHARQGLHSGYGFDVIVAGIIGCFAWGAGALLIVKGIGMLWLETDKDAALKRTMKAGLWDAVRGLNGTCWRLVLYVAGGHLVLTSLNVAQFLLGFLPPSALTSIIVLMAIDAIGLIGGGLYKTQVFRAFKAGAIRDVAVKALLFGVLSTACFGSGVPMLVTSLFMFYLGHLVNEASKARRQNKPETRVREAPREAPAPRAETPKAAAPVHVNRFSYDLFSNDDITDSDLFKKPRSD